MGLANADLLMNVQPRYTLAHLISGARSIEEVCSEGPGGVRFVAGASGLHTLANLSEFERQHLIVQLQKLESSTDILIMDCGAGISRNVTAFALASDRVLVVTTPQPPALTDGYATIKALHRERYAGQVGLFVNMAGSRGEAQAAHRRISEVARRFLDFSVANGGYMLQDTSVELAVQARSPFVIRYPGSNASACVAAMATEVAHGCVGPQRRHSGFFERVAGLFV
jgi:flagellar biosynthesis protein FlhG